MQVYRVARSKYARDLSGEGSRLNGGRWNHKEIPCLYTAESRALAVLEYTVNIEFDEIPRGLCIVSIEIPEQQIFMPEMHDLPGDWWMRPAPSSGRDYGSILLEQNNYAALRIPSVVVPKEYNYVLNPRHQLAGQFVIKGVDDFVYDIRIKQN
jgi:RES domain-containing protein